MKKNWIVGWMVFTDDPSHAAMYNRSERKKAFSAARRWNASITALINHPDAPDALPPEPKQEK